MGPGVVKRGLTLYDYRPAVQSLSSRTLKSQGISGVDSGNFGGDNNERCMRFESVFEKEKD